MHFAARNWLHVLTNSNSNSFFHFVFQAEDGIRDLYVTGVQTCALPICGPVAAYLVVPKGKGPFAAVLFGHWGHGTRAEFIPEAKIYARAGAVSLIPDYPWDRPS